MVALEFLGLVYLVVVIAAFHSLFDESLILFEETIYRCLHQILSFLALVLLIIRPSVISGMFVSPILVKTISFFLLPLSLA